jgi:hypothetical protein
MTIINGEDTGCSRVYGQGSPGVFSLSPVSNAVEGNHARASLFLLSLQLSGLSTQNGSHGQEQSHDNTTHDNAVLLTMSEAESGNDTFHVAMSGSSSHTSMVVALPKKGRERRSRTTVHPRKRGEKGSNQIISRGFDGVKPNPRTFPSDPIRSRWYRHLLVGNRARHLLDQ